MRKTLPSADDAIADRAFAFIAADEGLAAAMIEASGATADGLRSMAQSPQFALFLLDFLLAEDARVIAFAESCGIRPEAVLAARHRLEAPGEG